MADTLFVDHSQFQVAVDNRYPFAWGSFRVNDGNYRDALAQQNLAWYKSRVDSGHLVGFHAYFVWESNWQETLAVFKRDIGSPHPKMGVMIDFERWGGRYNGNLSAALNATREALIAWLAGNRPRVKRYGNQGDLETCWPEYGDCDTIIANYSYNPVFPRKVAHQFADNFVTPPFGACDINSADGYTPQQFLAAWGLDTPPPHIPAPVFHPPAPAPVLPKPAPNQPKESSMMVVTVSPASVPKGAVWPGIFLQGGLDLTWLCDSASANNYASVLPHISITYNQFMTFKKAGHVK